MFATVLRQDRQEEQMRGERREEERAEHRKGTGSGLLGEHSTFDARVCVKQRRSTLTHCVRREGRPIAADDSLAHTHKHTTSTNQFPCLYPPRIHTHTANNRINCLGTSFLKAIMSFIGSKNISMEYLPQSVVHAVADTCSYLLTEHCCHQFVYDFNIMDGACVKQAVTKGMGYGIIVASTLVKLPQVIKILKAKSGAGISVLGVLLEVLAISFNASYSFAKKYPFTAWGESLFLLFETALIAFLVMWFDGQRTRGFAFAVIHSAFLFVLMSGMAPVSVLWSLQACTLPLAVSGKMIQAYKNLKNGHTGQMSALTAWLLFLGCMARVFTSIQETGDQLIITTYIVASAANFVQVAQIHYYWSATEKALLASKKTD